MCGGPSPRTCRRESPLTIRFQCAQPRLRVGRNQAGLVNRVDLANAAVHVRELISALPPRQREALYLRYFAGFGYGEIATAMDCTADNARANVSQAV